MRQYIANKIREIVISSSKPEKGAETIRNGSNCHYFRIWGLLFPPFSGVCSTGTQQQHDVLVRWHWRFRWTTSWSGLTPHWRIWFMGNPLYRIWNKPVKSAMIIYIYIHISYNIIYHLTSPNCGLNWFRRGVTNGKKSLPLRVHESTTRDCNDNHFVYFQTSNPSFLPNNESIWVNYNNSLIWIKAIWGWFPES